jgi:hypothetical protein
MSALRRAFPVEKPFPVEGTIAELARPVAQIQSSTWDLVDCHGISGVKWGLGRPKTGSALQPLSNGS